LAGRTFRPAEQRACSEFGFWHIASFRGGAEFGRYRGIADMAGPVTGATRSRMTGCGKPSAVTGVQVKKPVACLSLQ